MSRSSTLERLVALYPAIGQLDPGEISAVWPNQTTEMTAPTGTVLFDEGSPCRGFPLVLGGSVRVARGSAEGRSLELYRVSPGELCVVSMSCLVGASPMSAHGQTTEATELVLLSPTGFARWTAHEAFRTFVFGVFSTRLADLMALAEAVAFQRLDRRLAHTLLGHGQELHTTHQALADELGTVREIVTRLLKRFENSGWVRLSRERIEILQPAALRALSDGAGRG